MQTRPVGIVMDDTTKNLVRSRAESRSEYCGIGERYFSQLFQIEHIRSKSHGGSDDEENLALACRRCNLHKGPNLSGIDPETEMLTSLFNPRTDIWNEHFEQLETGEIQGLTAIGRTTVFVLNMNEPRRMELRRAIAALEMGS